MAPEGDLHAARARGERIRPAAARLIFGALTLAAIGRQLAIIGLRRLRQRRALGPIARSTIGGSRRLA
jgi:hypothetical protein